MVHSWSKILPMVHKWSTASHAVSHDVVDNKKREALDIEGFPSHIKHFAPF